MVKRLLVSEGPEPSLLSLKELVGFIDKTLYYSNILLLINGLN